jgi:molecular chaperone GrpE
MRMSNPETPQQAMPNNEHTEPAGEPVAAETATTATATADATGEIHTDTLPSLEEQFRALELKAAEHYDAWLRAKAEGENIRRRAQEDISKAHKFAVEKVAGELLAVKDSLEAALAVPEQTVDSFKSGVELTLKQLVSAFEKNALVEVNPVGEKFDPHKHQAIGMVDAEQEANTVVTVLQKGYLIAERTLRPALVMVAKPKS